MVSWIAVIRLFKKKSVFLFPSSKWIWIGFYLFTVDSFLPFAIIFPTLTTGTVVYYKQVFSVYRTDAAFDMLVGWTNQQQQRIAACCHPHEQCHKWSPRSLCGEHSRTVPMVWIPFVWATAIAIGKYKFWLVFLWCFF